MAKMKLGFELILWAKRSSLDWWSTAKKSAWAILQPGGSYPAPSARERPI